MAAILASLMTWLDTPAVQADSGNPSGTPTPDKIERQTPAGPADEALRAASLFIQEYQVKGAHLLSRTEIEEAVYPFLGPGRTKDDVEQARAALETTYHDKGYQTVTVEIPPQQVRGGVVLIHVTEAPVGRLRVKGARYFLPSQIKAGAPSLAEGRVINFNEVPKDIVALNQLADRQVTPTLNAGAQPGTVDVDLTVKDSPPLHGSLELNNRYSANTTALRLNGSVSDSNLWQLGHTLGLSFQVSPEDFNQVKVFSGYYLVHVQSVDGLSLMLQGTKQDSNVSTLGGAAVAGRGETLGARALLNLPAGKNFYHSLSLGVDYKHFDQNVTIGTSKIVTPITYYPLSANYSATWLGQGHVTALDAGVTLHLRGTGSSTSTFDAKRFKADGGFIYFRGDLSHTHDLPAGFQVFGKLQGQISDEPLIDSEEFSGGGLDTARGYLEAEEIGDNGLFGTLELRSPSILGWFGHAKAGEWRVYAFGDAGRLTINDPLPEQTSRFDLASFGAGTRIRLQDHFSGSIDAAMPLTSQSQTKAHDLRLIFRAGVDY